MANSNDGHWDGAGPGKNAYPGAAKISAQGTSIRKGVEDQEEAMKMRDLLRRSIAALSALAKNESATVCERLADFKNSVQKATAIEEMETSLSALRNAIRMRRLDLGRPGVEYAPRGTRVDMQQYRMRPAANTKK